MRCRIVVWTLSLLLAGPVLAQPGDWRERAQTAVHMLDYIGVDYPEFVQDGEVLSDAEYREQLEFAGQVQAQIARLPANPRRLELERAAGELTALIEHKASGARVAQASAELRRALIEAYGLTVAPKAPPDLARAAELYDRLCAACHGAQGRGDGPAGKALEPPPSNFQDDARMRARSVYGLYNTITLGVEGTGMASYRQLSEAERWALAFYASRFALSDAELARGERAWNSGAHAGTFATLRDVVALSTDEVRARHGEEAAAAHLWLRAHPEAIVPGRPEPIRFSIETLQQSLAAYQAGDRGRAQQLAIQAYLEGFELVEASLDNVDGGLRTTIELEMIEYRGLLRSGADADTVRARAGRLVALLEEAQQKLGGEGLSPLASFGASFLILLREGLEAILVLGAIITFLVKSGRRDALPWVHVGWGAALVLGALTWFLATYVIGISGANREVTEGVTALLAAGMLLYVGLWLHSKAHSRAWQRFIRERVGAALARRTLWALALVSFLAVYRELFEIVLFYQALWAQAGAGARAPLFGGIAVAAMLLAALGWAMYRYGLRLPLGPFFTVTAILLAALAVVFAGQGVAALQEAGAIEIDTVPFIRVPALGIYPTLQTLAAQVLAVTLIGVGFYLTGRRRQEAR
jgi:high-affinity iron transporter